MGNQEESFQCAAGLMLTFQLAPKCQIGKTEKSPWVRKLEDSAKQQHTRRGKPLSNGVPGKGPLSVRHATTDSLD